MLGVILNLFPAWFVFCLGFSCGIATALLLFLHTVQGTLPQNVELVSSTVATKELSASSDIPSTVGENEKPKSPRLPPVSSSPPGAHHYLERARSSASLGDSSAVLSPTNSKHSAVVGADLATGSSLSIDDLTAEFNAVCRELRNGKVLVKATRGLLAELDSSVKSLTRALSRSITSAVTTIKEKETNPTLQHSWDIFLTGLERSITSQMEGFESIMNTLNTTTLNMENDIGNSDSQLTGVANQLYREVENAKANHAYAHREYSRNEQRVNSLLVEVQRSNAPDAEEARKASNKQHFAKLQQSHDSKEKTMNQLRQAEGKLRLGIRQVITDVRDADRKRCEGCCEIFLKLLHEMERQSQSLQFTFHSMQRDLQAFKNKLAPPDAQTSSSVDLGLSSVEIASSSAPRYESEKCSVNNELIRRVWRDATASELFVNQFRERLTAVLNSGSLPGYLDPPSVSEIEFGKAPPNFEYIKVLSPEVVVEQRAHSSISAESQQYSPEYDVDVESHFEWKNSPVSITVKANIWINWPREKTASIPVSIQIILVHMSAKVQFGFRKHKAYCAFVGEPYCRLAVHTDVANTKFLKNIPRISAFLVSHLFKTMRTSMIYPHTISAPLPWPASWWPAYDSKDGENLGVETSDDKPNQSRSVPLSLSEISGAASKSPLSPNTASSLLGQLSEMIGVASEQIVADAEAGLADSMLGSIGSFLANPLGEKPSEVPLSSPIISPPLSPSSTSLSPNRGGEDVKKVEQKAVSSTEETKGISALVGRGIFSSQKNLSSAVTSPPPSPAPGTDGLTSPSSVGNMMSVTSLFPLRRHSKTEFQALGNTASPQSEAPLLSTTPVAASTSQATGHSVESDQSVSTSLPTSPIQNSGEGSAPTGSNDAAPAPTSAPSSEAPANSIEAKLWSIERKAREKVERLTRQGLSQLDKNMEELLMSHSLSSPLSSTPRSDSSAPAPVVPVDSSPAAASPRTPSSAQEELSAAAKLSMNALPSFSSSALKGLVKIRVNEDLIGRRRWLVLDQNHFAAFEESSETSLVFCVPSSSCIPKIMEGAWYDKQFPLLIALNPGTQGTTTGPVTAPVSPSYSPSVRKVTCMLNYEEERQQWYTRLTQYSKASSSAVSAEDNKSTPKATPDESKTIASRFLDVSATSLLQKLSSGPSYAVNANTGSVSSAESGKAASDQTADRTRVADEPSESRASFITEGWYEMVSTANAESKTNVWLAPKDTQVLGAYANHRKERLIREYDATKVEPDDNGLHIALPNGELLTFMRRPGSPTSKRTITAADTTKPLETKSAGQSQPTSVSTPETVHTTTPLSPESALTPTNLITMLLDKGVSAAAERLQGHPMSESQPHYPGPKRPLPEQPVVISESGKMLGSSESTQSIEEQCQPNISKEDSTKGTQGPSLSSPRTPQTTSDI